MATITFTGNLDADPEIIIAPSGRQVVRMSVTEAQRRQNPDTGEWEDAEPNVFRVQAWDSLGKDAAEPLRSGQSVAVVGHIVTDRWTDKERGEPRTTQTVVADSLARSQQPRFPAQS